MTTRSDTTTLAWLTLLAFTVLALFAFPQVAWLKTYPEALTLPVQAQLNAMMDTVVAFCGPFFRAISAALDVPMRLVRDLLAFLPWPVTVIIFTGLAWAATGWRLAAFTLATMLYMLVIGYWAESMNSLALVAVSVPAAVMIGFGFGTLGFFSARARRPIEMLLDLLQTVPAFAYLLPILLLFGFGPVVGLIASVMYAFPPMVRNTMLGLSRVGPEVIESGAMSGATPGQLFWQVRVPSAKRQLLLGVNQTTMAAFSMVIIASIIGGTADIGWEVLSTMRKAQFGESLLAGIVIALMAMVMDRITAGFATRDVVDDVAPDTAFHKQHPVLMITVIAAVTAFALAQSVPALKAWPEAWEFYPADILNNAVTWLTVTYAASIALIKQYAFFFLMLPLKIGLKQTISPFSWGFEFTATLQAIYVVAAAAISLLAAARWSPRAGVWTALALLTLFFGLTQLPWPAVLGAATLLAWQLSGWRLALGTAVSLLFLVVSGVWPQTMLSVYLCGLAVALSFGLGTLLGIAAAEFKPVSAVLRPINDTLQTMPLFVILIPFVMIFKIGEFTALLAIMAYAIVPAIRYAEHGLRNVSAEVVEAARSMGATQWQLLWQVKVPLAWPVMMLGLNQTIMYGIAMLVIAALVGTNGLGQQVYIGLGDADFGVGIVAGIGMAIIAIIADRLTQAATRNSGTSRDEVMI